MKPSRTLVVDITASLKELETGNRTGKEAHHRTTIPLDVYKDQANSHFWNNHLRIGLEKFLKSIGPVFIRKDDDPDKYDEFGCLTLEERRTLAKQLKHIAQQLESSEEDNIRAVTSVGGPNSDLTLIDLILKTPKREIKKYEQQ